MRPVAEIQFGDFITPAFDQIVKTNQLKEFLMQQERPFALWGHGVKQFWLWFVVESVKYFQGKARKSNYLTLSFFYHCFCVYKIIKVLKPEEFGDTGYLENKWIKLEHFRIPVRMQLQINPIFVTANLNQQVFSQIA